MQSVYLLGLYKASNLDHPLSSLLLCPQPLTLKAWWIADKLLQLFIHLQNKRTISLPSCCPTGVKGSAADLHAPFKNVFIISAGTDNYVPYLK